MKSFFKIKKIFFLKKFSVKRPLLYSVVYFGGVFCNFFMVLQKFSIFFLFYKLYVPGRIAALSTPQPQPFVYLFVNFLRLQEFFSFVFANFLLCKAFSAGFLLKLFSNFFKKTRRAVMKHRPLFFFLKKFFLQKLSAGAELWFIGFKKKYFNVIFELHSWGFVSSTVWVLKKNFGAYKFRRVKAIKKRLRKSFR